MPRIGAAMKKQTARGRLRVHRETLRTLGATQLARVGGGTGEFPGETIDSVDPTLEAKPRTNAWTALAGAAVCGGGVTG